MPSQLLTAQNLLEEEDTVTFYRILATLCAGLACCASSYCQAPPTSSTPPSPGGRLSLPDDKDKPQTPPLPAIYLPPEAPPTVICPPVCTQPTPACHCVTTYTTTTAKKGLFGCRTRTVCTPVTVCVPSPSGMPSLPSLPPVPCPPGGTGPTFPPPEGNRLIPLGSTAGVLR